MNLFSPVAPACANRPPAGALILGGGLLGLIVFYSFHLWPEWRQNPDLSHGFFAPVVFGLLIWESRRLGPLRWLQPGPFWQILLGLAMVGGVGLFSLAGLFAAELAWSHALVLFLIAGSLACFLCGGGVILADARLRILPFNWMLITAIFLWVLVAPIPTGTYARLTLSLQSWVTGCVMNALQILGVPARQHGNVIELAHTTVGVAEACSGVRSLISCVYAGFFFAAWQVRRPARRLVLILIAPLLALGMNLLRSLTLTLLANSGTDITGTWHDATGFAILGVTAAILAGLAMLLDSNETGDPAPEPRPVATGSMRGMYGIFWTGGFVGLALVAMFYFSSRLSGNRLPDVPILAELVPVVAPGWQVRTPDDLYQFSDILHTTHLLERTYVRSTANRGDVQLTVYVAYWGPGQTSVSRVASHTPDACWPGSGWSAQITSDPNTQAMAVPGLNLAPAEHRLFRNANGYDQHVWFWHIFDGRAINYRDPYSLSALLKSALQYGFRRQGSQYFVRISSNRPWEELANEPLLRQILTNLSQVGL